MTRKKTENTENTEVLAFHPPEEVIPEALEDAPMKALEHAEVQEEPETAPVATDPVTLGKTDITAESGDEVEPKTSAPDVPISEDDGAIHLTLSLPVKMFEQSPGSMQRLKAAIGSKQTLLKKALGADSLNVLIEEDRVMFPWFTLSSDDNAVETDAYSKLVFALAKKAITQTRVDPVEKIPEDLQLGMRLYLINLNFKGDDFKSARAVLMRNFAKGGGVSVKDKKYELEMPEVYKS